MVSHWTNTYLLVVHDNDYTTDGCAILCDIMPHLYMDRAMQRSEERRRTATIYTCSRTTTSANRTLPPTGRNYGLQNYLVLWLTKLFGFMAYKIISSDVLESFENFLLLP